ncbi:hypothetical protein [Micromonospora sp. NPDC093277]|uniref:hypothetical protein n=1 Tax=Micromonospora sp. NPDC093277 TaxID=3364291 RepID=UPI00382DB81A
MNIRRWSAGVLAAALFVPGLAACKSEADSPGAGSTSAAEKPADPKEALLASTKELQQGNFTFTIKGADINGSGTVHLPSKSADMKMDTTSAELSMTMHLVFIDNDSWVNLELGGEMAELVPGFKATKGKYQHLDRSKLDGVKELSFDFADVDPASSEKMIKAITDVKQTGDGTYAGTVDATKAADSDLLDEDTVKSLGAQASALPFTAKVDGQGRLTELAVEVPAAGSAEAQTVTVTYADYGSATAPKAPPAGQVVEASEQLYEMFKG